MNNFALNTAGQSNSSFGFNLSKNSAALSNECFAEWREYIYKLCGIYFQDNKKYLLENRLQKRLNYLGIDTFEKYLDYVKYGTKRSVELEYLYEVITINETFFFRNQPQLNVLVSSVIPELHKSKSEFNRNKLRIWSAASSSGEEAYSIAMTIEEFVKPKFPGLRVEIVGTDINRNVLQTASKGIYREYSIRNTPSYYLKKYFSTRDGQYELNSNIKSMVSFKFLNLFDESSMRMMLNFDIIYCANVLIYFNAESKIQVVSNLYNALNKYGYLFIGYSETLHGISRAFKLVSYPKTIGYKKE
ncbi:MAG: protein-glutamate O-methyltransferase CheR [Melioribacteraceae bacterium]|nr:protein-glutamate O-methyltransferase CheR [Melioribacteraceae bacterium]MCF8353746.1 protein-glutamate O-methyltransferase CheR [Melioribacteraceae bacterium]MCF8392445.1 protein-glutamate O-methyltransferase CheR [Melioribacteraceae bacterium]MCF8418356.1 protein-glutamate O-methyltransferase CheR [Melioribacteraceae bacterium]